MHRFLALALVALPVFAQPKPVQTKRHLAIDDLAKIHPVGDPQLSPDGLWIAYTVATTDVATDKRDTDIWMVSWDGTQNIRLTTSPDAETAPRFSPDNKLITFTSSRPGKAKGNQIWAIDRRGGEAYQLTDFKQNLSTYAWSPDGKKLAVVLKEKDDPENEANPPADQKPKPIVLDRYHFKADIEGYLSSPHHARIYVYNLAGKKLDPVTDSKDFDESNPEWSPDSTRIAFVSKRTADWDRENNSDVWVVDAQPNSTPKRLTQFEGPDGGRLSWSPDGNLLAYTQGSDPKSSAYNQTKLAVVSTSGNGDAKVLTTKLDRNVSSPVFASDGKSIFALVADDRVEYITKIDVATGNIERVATAKNVISQHTQAAGHTAVLSAGDEQPAEIFALESGKLRKLTSHNDELFSNIDFGKTEDFATKTKDGTEVHGLLVYPPDYQAGKRYPMLLRIHGGPNGQDAHGFDFERQLFSASGYVVMNVNYRGSNGRGQKYQDAISGDWGNKEVMDLLAAVDYAVAQGIADPDKLGIGGWSYGGILTDYTIATTTRFKAAISGAGSANQITMYGTDQYSYQYDNEIGPPWKNPEAWIKISYPFFHADRIKTPTLYMGGQNDFNVPIGGSEQMYQALRSLNVPTQLIVYPGQFHGFTRPSFQKDRLERYMAWYNKWVLGETGKSKSE